MPRTGRRRALRRVAAFALLAIIAVTGLWAAPAAAAEFDGLCQQTGSDKAELTCDVRQGEVTARVLETGRTLQVRRGTPYPGPGNRSAVLFLVDLSDPARNSTVNANLQDVRRILEMGKPHHLFGLAALPGSGRDFAMQTIASIGTDRGAVMARLGELKARGAASPIFLSAIDGTRLLGNTDAKRRLLVLFSDGNNEGAGFSVEDVVAEARRQHVAIATFGVAENRGDAKYLSALRRMAEGTGGIFHATEAPNRRFSTATLDSLLAEFDSGGQLLVDLSEVLSGQTVELRLAPGGGVPTMVERVVIRDIRPATGAANTGTANTGATNSEPLAAAGPATTSRATTAVPGPATPDAAATSGSGWYQRTKNWVLTNWLTSIFIGLALVLLLLALVIWAVRASRRRRLQMIRTEMRAATPPDQTYRVTPAEAPRPAPVAFATLQPVLNGGAPHLVTTPMATIGRAKDCDICLNYDTVSAHHATLVRKRDGIFELTDMGSRNGVRVNGVVVNRQRLAPGDKIRFGAAPELCFVPGQEGGRAA